MGSRDARTPIAWVLGASGAWGRAVSLELLRRGFDIVALGRRDVPELRAWAARLGRGWSFAPVDLVEPDAAALPDDDPDALFVCAAATEGDRDLLVRANFLAPARLIGVVTSRMCDRGGGRIGVFVGQNARLGLAGLGDFSAGQASLWTWCEALADELRRDGGTVSLTRVIPPRTASATQRFVAERTGRAARVRPPEAGPIVDAVLAGRRHAGRRPVIAALTTLLR